MGKKSLTFGIGTDPECFLYDTIKKEFVPSFRFFNGKKDEAENLDDQGNFKVLCDNMMVEFNIPPSYNAKEFVQNITIAIDLIRQRLPEHIEIRFDPFATFKEEYLNHEYAQMFGCAPQEDIYNQIGLDCSDIPKNVRFAGGHIHFSCPYDLDIPRIVKCFDIFIGIPLSLEEPRLKNSINRSDIYGLAGIHRITSYGFEYRTPSNIWLQSNERIEWVFNKVEQAYSIYLSKELKLPSDNEIIMSMGDKYYAEKLMKNLLLV